MTQRIIGDSWYAEELGIDTVDKLAAERGWSKLMTSDFARGVLLWLFAREYDIVVTPLAGRSVRTLLVLDRFLGRRRGRYLVLLEFIPVIGNHARNRWGANSLPPPLANGFWRWIVGPVLQRHLLFAHSLTRWEIDRNAAHFRLGRERFRFVPFFGALDEPETQMEEGEGVFVSGRAACDWETVFAAAQGQDWPLTVVCGRGDVPRVSALNAGGEATILSEISRDEHAQLLRRAAVYLIALEEAEVSSGQVRLLDASVAGTAVVASTVRGLADYLQPNRTALVFAPGDVAAARSGVNRLLNDPILRRNLVHEVRIAGQSWKRSDYLKAIERLLHQAHAN